MGNTSVQRMENYKEGEKIMCDWVRYYLIFPNKGLKLYYDSERELEGAFYAYSSKGEDVKAVRKDFLFNLETVLMQTRVGV